jgi:hypothetical protein
MSNYAGIVIPAYIRAKKNGAGDVGGYISGAASRTTAAKGRKSAVVHATSRY